MPKQALETAVQGRSILGVHTPQATPKSPPAVKSGASRAILKEGTPKRLSRKEKKALRKALKRFEEIDKGKIDYYLDGSPIPSNDL